jgi:hypothetical protein
MVQAAMIHDSGGKARHDKMVELVETTLKLHGWTANALCGRECGACRVQGHSPVADLQLSA